MSHPSSWQAYWLIRSNRFRKKRAIKKQLVQLSFDKTTTFYSLIVGGYVFASIFIFNDFMRQFEDYFIFIEQQMVERFWLILTIVPIRYVFKSFRNPGVLITSSEYQLGMLPHSIKKIAYLVAIEKWIVQLILYLVISTLIILITPIDAQLIWIYFLLFWIIEVLMTIPQWKLFQAHLMVKLGIFLSLIILDIVGTMVEQSKLISIVILSMVIIANFLLRKKLFFHIHWGRVTEVNNYLVWSMPLISKATKTKFRRERKYSIFQNRASRKRPFAYTDVAIHKRLWLQHFRENIELILQVIGGLFLAIVILPFIHDIVVLIGSAISIHVYTSFVASMFMDRFHSGIVQVLPWDVNSFRNTMKHWSVLGFIPVMVPIIIYSIVHFSWWSVGFLFLIFTLFVMNLTVKMDNAVDLLDKKISQLSIKDVLAFLSLSLIVLCESQPFISLVSIILLAYVLYLNKNAKRRKHVG
ncbi:hypothetical protein [Paucisalibacillus sp. EB02]|uniref:hypothetical protein n=1 Tax=Paucisalibacillus sp. EB02 TaxID=1347087 RepID=UPI0004B38F4A|nr:hypothetical protein [Paucisalibacillus sp. EB02]